MPEAPASANGPARGGVIVLDSHSVLGQALCGALIRGGHSVLAHARGLSTGGKRAGAFHVHADRADTTLSHWNDPAHPIQHVVFGPPDDIAGDPDDLDGLAARLEDHLALFLAELQAAGRMLSRQGGGQIWVLTYEDSLRHAMPALAVSAAPIATRARHAAVKSFAKEMFRFGVRINAAAIQPVGEQFPPEAWQAARAGTKAYAIRFQPNPAAAVANVLCGFLALEDLPFVGMVVPIGIGVTEQNI